MLNPAKRKKKKKKNKNKEGLVPSLEKGRIRKHLAKRISCLYAKTVASPSVANATSHGTESLSAVHHDVTRENSARRKKHHSNTYSFTRVHALPATPLRRRHTAATT
jgi:hypothetical protein